MSRVLVVYVSRFGQAARIARHVGNALQAQGHEVAMLAEPRLLGVQLPSHDAVIVGASVQYGSHGRILEHAVRLHAQQLASLPNAFFSVSMSAAHPPQGTADAQRCVERFVARTGWHPRIAATFGGALAYTRYPAWKRWAMRLIARRSGGEVDASRDHEYTDWAQVDRFAREVAASLPAPSPKRSCAASTAATV
jgi:menaquinone-dependent protoporphyrinogen oxidase